MFPGETVLWKKVRHVGHGASIQGHLGTKLHDWHNAVVLDGAVIGSESIVGALALVKSKAKFERRSRA